MKPPRKKSAQISQIPRNIRVNFFSYDRPEIPNRYPKSHTQTHTEAKRERGASENAVQLMQIHK